MRKKFDKELYAANDRMCREAAKELLVQAGYKVIDSPKKMAVDLQVLDDQGNIKFYVEVERKAVWTTDEFPYENVNLPERKTKYAMLDKPTYYLMFSGNMKKYLVIKSADLLASPVEVVPNKYVAYGELFYKVPLNKVIFNKFSEE